MVTVIVNADAKAGVFVIRMTRMNPRCPVIASEPFAENFQCCEANVAASRLEKCDLL